MSGFDKDLQAIHGKDWLKEKKLVLTRIKKYNRLYDQGKYYEAFSVLDDVK